MLVLWIVGINIVLAVFSVFTTFELSKMLNELYQILKVKKMVYIYASVLGFLVLTIGINFGLLYYCYFIEEMEIFKCFTLTVLIFVMVLVSEYALLNKIVNYSEKIMNTKESESNSEN